MGNSIGCYGKDDQKRSGISVKTLLRKTEKPGKRRKRIDDLVVDALKREKRSERHMKKREKKNDKSSTGHEHLVDIITEDKKVEACHDTQSKESNRVNGEQSVNPSDLNNQYKTISGGNGTLFRYQKYDTSLNRDYVSESNEVRERSYSGFQEYYKVDLKEQLAIINGTSRSVEKLEPAYHEIRDNTNIDTSPKSTEYDIGHTELKERESTIELKDCATNSLIGDSVTQETEQDNEPAQGLKPDYISENDCKNNSIAQCEIGDENGRKEDEPDSTDCTAAYFENELNEDTERQNVDKGSIEEMSSTNTYSEHGIYQVKDKLPDIRETNEKDKQRENATTGQVGLHGETCDTDENSLDLPEINIVRDGEITNSTGKYTDINPGYDHNYNENDDKHIFNILKVHDDTGSTSKCDGNAATNNNDTVNVLKICTTDNLSGYDDTGLTYFEDDDEESINGNLDLEPIPRSKSIPLKQWGSLNDLRIDTRATKRTRGDTRKDISSFKYHLSKLKQIYALSKTRGQELKNHLQRTPTKRPTLKSGVMNQAVNGGQKPQIKEIVRLKKDPFNFPPKMQQFTERDRHGRIEDLKWSRHMRAEVRRHICMESAELDELMFLTGGVQNDDFEFDVCGESRSPTPVPDYDEPRSPSPVPEFDEPRAPTPVPDFYESRAPTPGYDFRHAHSPVSENIFPRAPSGDLRYFPQRTRTSKMRETMKKLRERYGTDRLQHIRQNTTNRLTPCSRHSKPNTTNHRLNTHTGDRKKAAFQTIIRQFEKSFKDAEARRSQELKGHSRNNTSSVGIGRQNSFMNLGDDTDRRDI